jgi:hypothetical protein
MRSSSHILLKCKIFTYSWVSNHITQSITENFVLCRLTYHFPKAKIPVETEEICECDGHTEHKLS